MWMLSLALIACGGAAPEDSAAPAIGRELGVVPPSIDFGLVKVGETATTPLTLRNLGDEAIELVGVFPSSDIVVVDDSDRIRLGPGDEQVIQVRWTPMTTDDWLQVHLDLPLAVRPPATVTIPVVGSPSWGSLGTSQTWYGDGFGSVSIGCAREVTVQIANWGLAELTLESVTFSGPDEFSWSGVETPLVFAPKSAISFDATFVPTVPGYFDATVHIESDDPDDPVVDRVLPAQAVAAPGPVSLSWTVPPRPTAITSVIAVNSEVAPRIQRAFESFFDVLRGSELPFRVAIIGDQGDQLDPSVSGPYPYIDDGFSAEESDDAIAAMLDGIGGDEDAGLALLEAAIAEHRDWLLDVDAPWPSSTLHLTFVNPDAEQSPNPAAYYVERYLEWKGDAGPLFVNGIAGRPPAGCAGGPGGAAAAPSENLLDATEETGGVFLSICDDLTTTVRALAANMVAMFPLTDPPLDSNITVTVDGTKIESGWVYLPESNAIRFDDESYPDAGSVVGIEYGTPLVCE